MKRRLLTAVVVAILFAGALAVTVRANEGPYRPLICQHLDPSDWQWWYYECWLPDDPENGKVT